MFRVLGWINIGVLSVIILLYVLRRINKYVFNNKNKQLIMITKKMSQLHPFLGVYLVFSAFLHGYMIVGRLKIHSGYIAWVLLLVQGILGILVKKIKKKSIITIHRLFGIVLIISVVIHIILV